MSARRPAGEGGLLSVRVTPRARREEIAGVRDGAILVRTTAAPQDGQANAAVVRLLAKRLGVPQSRVRLVRGGGAREKLLRVEGMSSEEATRRLLDEP